MVGTGWPRPSCLCSEKNATCALSEHISGQVLTALLQLVSLEEPHHHRGRKGRIGPYVVNVVAAIVGGKSLYGLGRRDFEIYHLTK